MPIPEFEFTHPLGHRDVNHYLQNPPSEEIWRDYLNEMPFEIRTYLKETVKAYLDDYLTHKADKTPHIVPTAMVYNNANQSIPNGTSTVLVWNVEVLDNDAMFDAASNTVFTCKTAGRYLIIATINFAASTSGTRSIKIQKNSDVAPVAFPTLHAVSYGALMMTAIGISTLAVNDTISIRVTQTSGGALDITPIYTPQFIAVKVG